MKFSKIFTVFGIAIILFLLAVTIPATPAQAARGIKLDPERGSIGDKITVTGTGFNKSTATADKYAAIYFSSQEATTLDDIGTNVTRYEIVKDGVLLSQRVASTFVGAAGFIGVLIWTLILRSKSAKVRVTSVPDKADTKKETL